MQEEQVWVEGKEDDKGRAWMLEMPPNHVKSLKQDLCHTVHQSACNEKKPNKKLILGYRF